MNYYPTAPETYCHYLLQINLAAHPQKNKGFIPITFGVLPIKSEGIFKRVNTFLYEIICEIWS